MRNLRKAFLSKDLDLGQREITTLHLPLPELHNHALCKENCISKRKKARVRAKTHKILKTGIELEYITYHFYQVFAHYCFVFLNAYDKWF